MNPAPPPLHPAMKADGSWEAEDDAKLGKVGRHDLQPGLSPLLLDQEEKKKSFTRWYGPRTRPSSRNDRRRKTRLVPIIHTTYITGGLPVGFELLRMG